MNITEKVPQLIEHAVNESWKHVFLVSNPVTLIVSKLLIETLKLDVDKILIISLRRTETSSIGLPSHRPARQWIDRFLVKFCDVRPLTQRILNYINNSGERFVLYTAWDYEESGSIPSVRSIIDNKMCMGHFYLEEGQQSYRPTKPYPSRHKDKSYAEITKQFKDDEDRLNHRQYYGDDGSAFFGLFEEVYPNIPPEEVFICNDFNILKKVYEPFLLDIDSIAISCAERRLKKNGLDFMLRALVDELPDGGVMKLHPSFYENGKKVLMIEKKLKHISNGMVALAPPQAIIEIEMLFSEKKLIGSLTSLIRYASYFGSTYKEIKLY